MPQERNGTLDPATLTTGGSCARIEFVQLLGWRLAEKISGESPICGGIFRFRPLADEERMKKRKAGGAHSRPKNAPSSRKLGGGRRRGVTEYARKAWSYLPAFMFVAAVAIASFGGGMFVVRYNLFPYMVVSDGLKTLRTVRDTNEVVIVDDGRFIEFSDVPLEDAFENRIRSTEGNSLGESLLWYGGRFQFMDLCPEWGCLAVEFGTDGEVAHAYPLRYDALEQAANAAETVEFPYELAPTFSFPRDVYPAGMSQYPNGDLLVVFHIENSTSFPFGGGAARIDRDGYPVWFQQNYSHHWPYIEEDGSPYIREEDSALAPGHFIGNRSISFQIKGTYNSAVNLNCDTERPYLDTVNVIAGYDGRIIESIDLVQAIRDSPFAPILRNATHPDTGVQRPCDPVHLNFVRRIGDDAEGAWGMSPGDLVVSMRSLSAFAVIDGESHQVKRIVRGTFLYQHAVQHLEGSRFLMLDNMGSDEDYGPSRLLMVDLADGRETTIFPNEHTPESLLGLYTPEAGNVHISPDRRRAIAVFSNDGVAVEVRLSDGEVLNVFRSLHDVSDLNQFSGPRSTSSALFQIYGVEYIRN